MDVTEYTEQVQDWQLVHFVIQSLVGQLLQNRAVNRHDVTREHTEVDLISLMTRLNVLEPKYFNLKINKSI